MATSPQGGQFLTDLRPEDIEIREDGVPQKTALLEGGKLYPRTVPLEIALLFDCSGSVQASGRLGPHIFHTSLLDEYENAKIAVYGFSEMLVRFTGPTRDGPALMKVMNAVGMIPAGGTPLFRSIAQTVRDAAEGGGNAIRLPAVVSDGMSEALGDDNLDMAAIQAALETGTAIYPVLLPATSAGLYQVSASYAL